MAEEKFPFLIKARALINSKPWTDDIEDKLEELCKQAGAGTAEARMIGIALGGVITKKRCTK